MHVSTSTLRGAAPNRGTARPSKLRRNRRVAAALAAAAATLSIGVGSARADSPTVIVEDNTGFRCDSYSGSKPQVIASINYDAVSGSGYSAVDVLSPDGEVGLATGFTDDVRVGDGVVSARYPLIGADGSSHGEVLLVGTYVATAAPVTLHNRYRYDQNAQIIGTLTYTPLEVAWTSFLVGDYDVSDRICEGQRSESRNRVLEPHRFVRTSSDLDLIGRCESGALTRFSVVESEVGVGLALAVDGYEGFTNLDLLDGGDTQSVAWYAPDAGDPADLTDITVTLTEEGHRRSVVDATPDGLVLMQIQPVTLAYEVGLPAGAGTVSGSCGADVVVLRTAVEPVDG